MSENTIMSNEEALNRIKDMMREQNDFLQTRNTYALSMAYEALEYRTPKKVIKVSNDLYICPTCGLGPQKFYISCCDNCGQVLDWSEVDE